jgi:hypothetical protein
LHQSRCSVWLFSSHKLLFCCPERTVFFQSRCSMLVGTVLQRWSLSSHLPTYLPDADSARSSMPRSREVHASSVGGIPPRQPQCLHRAPHAPQIIPYAPWRRVHISTQGYSAGIPGPRSRRHLVPQTRAHPQTESLSITILTGLVSDLPSDEASPVPYTDRHRIRTNMKHAWHSHPCARLSRR